jgi:hypothetical protein
VNSTIPANKTFDLKVNLQSQIATRSTRFYMISKEVTEKHNAPAQALGLVCCWGWNTAYLILPLFPSTSIKTCSAHAFRFWGDHARWLHVHEEEAAGQHTHIHTSTHTHLYVWCTLQPYMCCTWSQARGDHACWLRVHEEEAAGRHALVCVMHKLQALQATLVSQG